MSALRVPSRRGRGPWAPSARARLGGACLLAVLALLAGRGTASAQTPDGDWQIGTFPSFSSGRYGGVTSTEVLHTPITARRLFGDGDLTLVFPYTCVRGDGGVTVVNGIPVRTERLERAGTRHSISTCCHGPGWPSAELASGPNDSRCTLRGLPASSNVGHPRTNMVAVASLPTSRASSVTLKSTRTVSVRTHP